MPWPKEAVASGHFPQLNLIGFPTSSMSKFISPKTPTFVKNDLNFSSEMEASEEYNLFMQIAAIGKIHSTEKIHADYRILEDSLTNKFKKSEQELHRKQLI